MTMKKILVLLAMALTLNAMAQNAVGDWMIHTSFAGGAVTSVIESRRYVYYQSGSHLFRLDKSTGENESLSKINEMSDMGVSATYYNSEKDYTVVVYRNSNLDVMLSDGTTSGLPPTTASILCRLTAVRSIITSLPTTVTCPATRSIR